MRTALHSFVAMVFLVTLLGGCTTPPTSQGGTSNLVGNWRLVTAETERDTGEISTSWMGERPTGLITYQPNGLMSVQLMRDPRPVFAAGVRTSATPEEIRKAFFGYYAYWGTFTVDTSDDSVTHQVTASLFPEEVGITYKRFFKMEGPRLVLTTAPLIYDGRKIVNRLTWVKVPQ